MSDTYRQFNPFFDQEEPQLPIDGLIASEDISASYELDAAAVFKAGHRYLVVFVSGCSCWPSIGSTYQAVCESKVDVDRALTGSWQALAASCQARNWEVTEPYKTVEKEKEFEGMFDTFKEVVDRIDGRAGGWETVTTTLVTPDGKRWKMSKIRVVFTDDNEEDELECELVEVPNRT